MGTVNEKVYKVNIEGVEDVDKLKQSVDNLNGSLENTENQSNDTANSIGSLRTQLRNLRTAMEQMDTTSEEYANAMAQAAEMTHKLSDMQQQIRLSSPDVGDQLNNIRGIAANLAAGYSAVNAAMGLFGAQNTEIKETLLKVQQAMALVQGLQGMAGFLKKTEGLSTAMKNWIKNTKTATTELKKETTATQADTLAKGGQTVATNGATKAQLGLNAAMKANPIGLVIGAVTTLIALFDIFSSKANKEAENEKIRSNIRIRDAKLYLEEQEAKYGAEWKYTKEGIELYEEYFNLLQKEYNKDVERYNKALAEKKGSEVEELDKLLAEEKSNLNERFTYRRETLINQRKLREEEYEWELKKAKAYYGEEYEYTLDWFNKRKKIYEDAKKFYENITVEPEVQKDLEKERELNEIQWLEFYDKYNEYWKKKSEERVKTFQNEYSKYLDITDSLIMKLEDSDKIWKDGVEGYKNYLKETYKYTDKQAQEIVDKLKENADKADFDSIVKNFSDELLKSFSEMDNKTKDYLDDLENEFQKKKLTLGIKFPEDEINHIEDIYSKAIENISNETDKLQKQINAIFSAIGPTFSAETVEALGAVLPEFQKLLDKQHDLNAQRVSLENDMFQQISDIRREEADRELEMIERNGEAQANALKKQFELETLANERKKEYGFGQGYNAFIQLDKEEENIKAYYEMYDNMFNSLIAKYKEMSTNMELTAEERENALAEAARLGAEQEAMAMQKSIDLMDIAKERAKTLADTFKSAFASMQSSISSLMGSWNSLINTEKQEINQELKAGKISEEEAERRHEANKKEFETFKKFQIAEAVINALASAVGAYQSMASIPYVGPALGALAAAAALAAGYAQVRQIQATTYDGNTSGIGGGGYEYTLPDVMDLEPGRNSNNTGESDEDELNGGGGRSEGPIRAYVVQSDLEAAQKYSNKLNQETTF